MVNIRRLSLFFVLFTLAFCAAGAKNAWALSVDGVRIGQHPDKVRIVFDLSEKAAFKISALTAPPRLVIDLPPMDWHAGTLTGPPGSGIRSVEPDLTAGPGRSRIIILMSTPVTVRSAFFLPRDQEKPDRLVVDFRPGSAPATPPTAVAAYVPPPVAAPPPPGTQSLGTLKLHDARGGNRTLAPPHPPSLPTEQNEAPPQQMAAATATSGEALSPPARKPERERPISPSEKRLIVIDPGHGGVDPGATGTNGALEKNITLAMAQELKRQLEATGRYKVKMTREKDNYLRLYQRVDFARQNKADLFVSLHADSIGKSNVRGISVYTLSEKASDSETERLALRENRADLVAGVDLSDKDDMVANILVDLAMRDTLNQSNFFANTAADVLRLNGIRLLENPHRSAGFAVLKNPDTPSILVEMGFLSNRGEVQMLMDAGFRQKLARALTDGIDAYFGKVREDGKS